MRHRFFSVFVRLSFIAVGLLSGASSPAKTLSVIAGIEPTQFLIDRIGGIHVQTSALLRSGQNHETYQVTGKQMAQASETDLIVFVGLGFERILHQKLLPHTRAQWLDLSQSIQLRPATPGGHACCNHDHADHGSHNHSGESSDPHFWLSASKSIPLARAIHSALSRLDPENQNVFDQNLAVLIEDLQKLESELRQSFEAFQGRSILTVHPAFGYLTDDLGLVQLTLEVEGKQPSAIHIKELQQLVSEQKISFLISQPNFSSSSTARMAQTLNLTLLELDPLAYPLIENIRMISQQFLKTLRQ